MAILPHLLVEGIHERKGCSPNGRLRHLFSSASECSSITDLGLRWGHPAQLLGNRLHFANEDTLDLHLRQRQQQDSFTSQTFLQRVRVEPTFTHMRDRDGDVAHPGVDHLWLEALSCPSRSSACW